MNTIIDNNAIEEKVRSVVRSELFWRDFYSSFASSQAKKDLEDNLKELIRRNFSDFENCGAKRIISQEIMATMPTYLNDNAKMKKLFKEHKDKLNDELKTSAQEILSRISNEDTYHTMQNEVRKSAEARSSQLLNDLNIRHGEQLSKHLSELKEENKKEMDKFKEANSKIENMNETIYNMKTAFVVIGSVTLLNAFMLMGFLFK